MIRVEIRCPDCGSLSGSFTLATAGSLSVAEWDGKCTGNRCRQRFVVTRASMTRSGRPCIRVLHPLSPVLG